MAADRLAQALRQQLGLGRLLPLGQAEDGTWIAERAAAGVLRRSARGVRGIQPARLRIAMASGPAARPGPVPAPPSALPHGPLRLEAECTLGADALLPQSAGELRTVLFSAASGRLGLLVQAVDLHVAELAGGPTARGTEEAGFAAPAGPHTAGPPAEGAAGEPGRAARAAVSVPGVLGLAPVLGGRLPAVREAAGGLHVQVELAVAENRRALDVARDARAAVHVAVASQTDGPVTVAVLITAIAAP